MRLRSIQFGKFLIKRFNRLTFWTIFAVAVGFETVSTVPVSKGGVVKVVVVIVIVAIVVVVIVVIIVVILSLSQFHNFLPPIIIPWIAIPEVVVVVVVIIVVIVVVVVVVIVVVIVVVVIVTPAPSRDYCHNSKKDCQNLHP